MRAGMFGQIDQFRRFAYSAQGGFGHRFRFTRQRDHAAVVVRVAFVVEQIYAANLAHGRDDRVDFGRVAAFGKIRNTLNNSFHLVASGN